VRNMTHSYVQHDSFICVSDSCIYTDEATKGFVGGGNVDHGVRDSKSDETASVYMCVVCVCTWCVCVRVRVRVRERESSWRQRLKIG